MLYLTIKAALSGVIIAIVSEVARRSPTLGALIVSLPLVSILGILWLWHDTTDAERIATHAQSTFWYVLPTLPMFLVMPAMLRHGIGFLGHARNLLRADFRALSLHDLGARKIRRDLVTRQTQDFLHKTFCSAKRFRIFDGRKFFELMVIVLPQNFHERRACYVSAPALLADVACPRVKTTETTRGRQHEGKPGSRRYFGGAQWNCPPRSQNSCARVR